MWGKQQSILDNEATGKTYTDHKWGRKISLPTCTWGKFTPDPNIWMETHQIPLCGKREWQSKRLPLLATWDQTEEEFLCMRHRTFFLAWEWATMERMTSRKCVSVSAPSWREWNDVRECFFCPTWGSICWWSVRVGKDWQSCHTPLPSNNCLNYSAEH